ncbi:MAG: C10 family peptidase, partial [Saprospiraceae bacterium]
VTPLHRYTVTPLHRYTVTLSKLLKPLILLSLLLLIISCQKSEEVRSSEKDQFQVMYPEIEKIIGIFGSSNGKGIETRSHDIKIKETSEKKDDKANAAIYFVNYLADSKEKFAILSGDKRELPVLASGDGFQDFYSIPDGPKQWVDERFNNIIDLRKNNKSMDPEVAKIWADYDGLPSNVITEPGDPGCNTFYINQAGPLTSTAWAQECYSFDYFAPIIPGYCGNQFCTVDKAYLGCVAVALGQIMKYNNFGHFTGGTTYNWSGMDNTVGSTSSTGNSKLMGDIFTWLNPSYDCYGTGSNNNAANYTLNQFGYNSSSIVNLSLTTVKSQITNNHVVYCSGFPSSGAGHAWVIDGYKEIVYPCFTYVYYQCNWGWHGDYNGLYTDGFKPQSTSYNNSRKLIINVY